VTDKGSAAIEELVDLLTTAGYQVTNVGTRYRIVNPEGGAPVFMPHRLPKGARLNQIVAGLHSIGFDIDKAKEAAEQNRQARLKADREAGERALAEATRAARTRRPEGARTARITAPAYDPFVPDEVAVPTRQVEPRTEVMEITPEFAKELLTANRFYEAGVNHAGRCNRRFRSQHAQDFADAMLRGEWVLAESIKFDVEQELVDGQHRLVAVVIAGEAKPDIQVPFLVTYDMPTESTMHYDTGLKRTTPDQLQMRGEVQSLHLSATLRLISLYDSVDPRDGSEPVPFNAERWRRGNFTTQQAMTLLDREPAIRHAVAETSGLRDILPQSSAAAGLHLIRRDWPMDAALDFVEKLRLGTNLSEKDPIYVLRETFLWMRRKQQGRQALRTYTGQHLALWIMAWNMHARGKERSLRFTWLPAEDPYPTLIRPSDVRRRIG
jgi:hypothetical protein